jgi:hypothetical protein
MRTITKVMGAATVSALLCVGIPARALDVTIHGHHDPAEIKKKCDAAGGSFTQSGSASGCTTNCKGGEGAACGIQCNTNKGANCTGWVPDRTIPMSVKSILTGSAKNR